MKNSFCLCRVKCILVAVFLLLVQTAFAQNFTNYTEHIAETNITGNETNTDNTTNNTSQPILDIVIFYPKKLTRGETIEIKAVVTNIGTADANNYVINWLLPSGFEIISQQNNNGLLAPGSSYESIILVKTSLFAELGPNEIKTMVSYE